MRGAIIWAAATMSSQCGCGARAAAYSGAHRWAAAEPESRMAEKEGDARCGSVGCVHGVRLGLHRESARGARRITREEQ